jgi:hypothetical protein
MKIKHTWGPNAVHRRLGSWWQKEMAYLALARVGAARATADATMATAGGAVATADATMATAGGAVATADATMAMAGWVSLGDRRGVVSDEVAGLEAFHVLTSSLLPGLHGVS